MKKVLFFILFIPMFSFVSFPVKEDFQLIDTIIINGKKYIGVGVDSISNYPIEKETLAEYRARLKNQNINYVKKPINLGRIILIVSVLALVLGYLLLLSIVNYEETINKIETVTKKKHHELLVDLAENIFDIIFKNKIVKKVNLKLEKLDIIKNTESVGIEVSKKKDE